MMTDVKRRSAPPPKDPQNRATLEALVTLGSELSGSVGDPLQRAVRLFELVGAGGFSLDANGRLVGSPAAPVGGAVTSVALSVPTGMSVAGSPITTSGTFTVTYSAGYQGYTSAEASKLSGIAAGATVGATWGTNLNSIPANITSWAGIAPSAKQNALGFTPVNKAGDTMTGSLVFSGAALRIMGDFNSAPQSNRTLFQAAAVGGNTQVGAIPNGSGNTAIFVSYNSSDADNAAAIQLRANPGEMCINSVTTGAGVLRDIHFQFNGLSKATLNNSGAFATTGGISTTGDISATGNVTAYASDIRLKTNIKPYTGTALYRLEVVDFDWDQASIDMLNPGFKPAAVHEVGMIAQQVGEEYPLAMAEHSNGIKTIRWEKLVPLLVAEVQRLHKRVTELENK